MIWINAFFEGENSKKDEKLFKVVQKRDGGDDGTVEEKEDEMRGCTASHKSKGVRVSLRLQGSIRSDGKE